jgi:hypothetical protein
MVLAERAAIAGGLRKHGQRSAAPFHRLRNNDLTQNEFYGRAGDKKGGKKPAADDKKKDEAGEGKEGEKGQKEGKPKADPMRNKSFADELKKQKTHAAVVDYVVSASRFKLTLPQKSYILTLSLTAIRSGTLILSFNLKPVFLVMAPKHHTSLSRSPPPSFLCVCLLGFHLQGGGQKGSPFQQTTSFFLIAWVLTFGSRSQRKGR